MEYRPTGLSKEIVGTAERIHYLLLRERSIRRNVDVDHPVAFFHGGVAADEGRSFIGDLVELQPAEPEDLACEEIVDPAKLIQTPVTTIFITGHAPYLDVPHGIDIDLVRQTVRRVIRVEAGGDQQCGCHHTCVAVDALTVAHGVDHIKGLRLMPVFAYRLGQRDQRKAFFFQKYRRDRLCSGNRVCGHIDGAGDFPPHGKWILIHSKTP